MWDRLKPALLMIGVQIVFSACNILYKFAIFDGMSTIVIAAYRLAFAAVTTIPLALIFERKRPKMTWRVFNLSLLSGLFAGLLFQNLFYGALVLAPATLVSAIYNLVPSITFVLAVSFGLEKLNWGAATGKAKVAGTILGLAGALLLIFYKGVEFDIWPFAINLLDPNKSQTGHVTDTTTELLGFIVERDLNEWKLGWDVRLFTVAFSGILASGVMILVMAWVVQMKGPLYASAFNPLMLLFVAIVASMLLDEKLNLGSILGGALIVCGLYTVLWGKGGEIQKKIELEPTQFGDFEATRPLLSP
ncbi:auxin-induced protein 5ng4-like [Trifolium pratense]|uniref:WAT1-related protein n=1 Tax=Trifolium pratense TaxID=57577 RepID=A0A2K3NZ60_TRIPR|nr:auxin-induced protein 5ng4-like [Trifolium pratense]